MKIDMKIENMRKFIGAKYPSQSWKSRVARMAPKQVIAIYHSMVAREAIHDQIKKDMEKHEEQNKQLDIFDVFGYKILKMSS